MTKIESYSTLQQSNDSSATKGTASNPYTENEFETMLDNGTWQGGFVENMGYCLGNVVVTASYPDSDSMDSYELWLSDDYTLLDGYSQSENETENTADGGNGNMQYRFGNTQSGTGDNVDINNYTGVNENKLNTLSANNGNSNIAKKFPSPTNKISKAGVRIFTQRVKKSKHSTLSRFTAAAYGSDGSIISDEILTGYFLERVYDLNKATVSGSNTAILAGEYAVVPGTSGQKYDWYLENVPGRGGIAIHSGNQYTDTAGCLLIGETSGTSGEDYTVLQSRAWLKKLSALLNAYGMKNILISITNAF